MALTDFFEDFVMQDKASIPDGFGGITYTYKDGAPFRAGITTKNSTEAQIAERNGMKKLYAIVVSELVNLYQNDRVKRLKDGRIYRITSDAVDMTTPPMSDMNFRQVSAEVVE